MKIVFFGSPAFAVPSLEVAARDHDVVAVVTQPDRPAGRGQKPRPPAVKEAALARGLRVLQPEGVRSPEIIAELAALGADAFVVVAYGRILPQALLDVPPRGAWNVHASLLPELRGAAPIQWAIMRGDRQTGVTIMRMEAGLDSGPVAAMARLDIGDDDTTATLSPRLATLGAELLGRTLRDIADGTVHLDVQDHARATRARPLTKEDGQLDFSQSAAQVSARARGVDPWPGAFTLLRGVPVKLFEPRIVAGPARAAEGSKPSDARGAAPGTVLALGSDGAVIACGDGAIAFAALQWPGRSRIGAEAAAAGRALAVGDHLG